MNGVKICGRLADKLGTKGFGIREGKCVILSYEEALYLGEKGFEGFDFKKTLKEASKDENFDVRFFVYRDLKSRGYVVKIRGEYYESKKSYSMNFYPLRDMDYFEFEKFYYRDSPFALAVVDGDGDVTYYMVDHASPEGERHEKIKLKNPYPAGARVFLLDSYGDLKTYGKKEGIFAHLSNYEAKYLDEGLNIPVDEEVYEVYENLKNRGLVVKSGFKYGTHFRCYLSSLNEHSKYLVHVVPPLEDIQKVSRAVRVAHGVRKTLLLSRKIGNEVKYLSVTWIRP